MNKDKIISSSKILYNEKLNAKELLDLNNEFKTKNINDAYKIQEELKINYLTLKNNICIGKKVGCTNKWAQKQINVDEPFYGNLFSKYSSISGCKLKSNNFSKPYLEPEFSFRIKEDINISKDPFTFNQIIELRVFFFYRL